MSRVINLPVTGYVYKFLLKTQLSPVFDLSSTNINYPRIMFLSVGEFGLKYSNLFPTHQVQVKLGNVQALQEYYQKHQDNFDRGIFGLYQFYEQLYLQVWMTVMVKQDVGLGTRTKINTVGKAVQQFLDRYEIDEDTYSYLSAYSQYMRMKQKYQNLIPR